MLQNTFKTLGSKKSMVYKNTPGGGGGEGWREVNHIWLVGYYEFQNEKNHF